MTSWKIVSLGLTVALASTVACSSSSSASPCDQLATCCSDLMNSNGSITEDQISECTATVGTASQQACTLEMNGFQQSGYCSADAGSRPSSGGASTGPNCTALEACCNSSAFPSEGSSACSEEVSVGDEAACSQALSGFKAANDC
jgi:hypothetical protein